MSARMSAVAPVIQPSTRHAVARNRAAQLVTVQLAAPVVQRRRGVDATAQAIIAIIDGALGNYFCLSADDQAAFADKRDELRAKRLTVDGKRGNDPVPEPTECKPVG
jgi:hypothetical protein